MSSRYRFDISINGFPLKSHTSDYEQSGLDYCKRYMSKFQRQVANLTMKIAVHDRGKLPERWMYHGAPYIYVKTLIKKPRTLKTENRDEV